MYSHCNYDDSGLRSHTVTRHPIQYLLLLFPHIKRTLDSVTIRWVMEIKLFPYITKMAALPINWITKFLKMISNVKTIIWSHIPRPMCKPRVDQVIFSIHRLWKIHLRTMYCSGQYATVMCVFSYPKQHKCETKVKIAGGQHVLRWNPLSTNETLSSASRWYGSNMRSIDCTDTILK